MRIKQLENSCAGSLRGLTFLDISRNDNGTMLAACLIVVGILLPVVAVLWLLRPMFVEILRD